MEFFHNSTIICNYFPNMHFLSLPFSQSDCYYPGLDNGPYMSNMTKKVYDINNRMEEAPKQPVLASPSC